MRSHALLPLSVLTGVALGIAGTAALGAYQATPAAYVVAEEDVTDPQTFQQYAAQVPATLTPFGGHYLVRNGRSVSLEGEPPRRFVIVAFKSLDKARAWYDSPAYSAIRPIRQRASKTRGFIVEGIPLTSAKSPL